MFNIYIGSLQANAPVEVEILNVQPQPIRDWEDTILFYMESELSQLKSVY